MAVYLPSPGSARFQAKAAHGVWFPSGASLFLGRRLGFGTRVLHAVPASAIHGCWIDGAEDSKEARAAAALGAILLWPAPWKAQSERTSDDHANRRLFPSRSRVLCGGPESSGKGPPQIANPEVLAIEMAKALVSGDRDRFTALAATRKEMEKMLEAAQPPSGPEDRQYLKNKVAEIVAERSRRFRPVPGDEEERPTSSKGSPSGSS